CYVVHLTLCKKCLSGWQDCEERHRTAAVSSDLSLVGQLQAAIDPNTTIVRGMMHYTQSASGSLFQWKAPDGAFSIALDSSVVDDLRRRTIEAYTSLPKRKTEIGSLLFGKRQTKGAIKFEVENCEEIACEYRFGPSYKLSESDYRRL